MTMITLYLFRYATRARIAGLAIRVSKLKQASEPVFAREKAHFELHCSLIPKHRTRIPRNTIPWP